MYEVIHKIDDFDFLIEIVKTNKKGTKFTVTYGKQFFKDLTYEKAAHQYGEAVMHALGLKGKLDPK